MLKKLRLDQTKSYEICIATEKIATMLVSFIQGRAHSLTIGCEQGDIDKWDDLIVEHTDRTLEHIQVKRNFTDFSSHSCDRSNALISRGDNAGKPHPLSPIDSSIKALSDWTRVNDPSTSLPKRKFSIDVPSMSTLIKEGLEVRHLYDFCREISPSTTGASLVTLAAANPTTQKMFLWLTTWCDFDDWQHILKAFRCLEVRQVGTEVDIENRTEEKLAECFHSTEAVRKAIHLFINENSSYTSAITPRPLFGELKPYWLSNIPAWTQYNNNGSQWDISGTIDHDFNCVEKAKHVVDGFWTSANSSVVKVHGDMPTDEPMPTSIMRLILHLPSQATAHVEDSARWQDKAREHVGGTLGFSEEDCQTMPVIESSGLHLSSDSRPLSTLDEIDKEGKELAERMNHVNWVQIVVKVDQKIKAIPASDLRTAVEQRWADWKIKLEQDHLEQVALCQQMLHPEAEGQEILSILRLGPKTANLVAKGILILLTVAVALSDQDEGWQKVGSGLSIKNKALMYWSGPSGKRRKIRLLTDEGISSLIGKEATKILVLSGINSTTTEITESSLAENSNNSFTLASPHQPMLLITNSMKLTRLINSGDLGGIKMYINQELNKAKTEQQNQVRTIIQ